MPAPGASHLVSGDSQQQSLKIYPTFLLFAFLHFASKSIKTYFKYFNLAELIMDYMNNTENIVFTKILVLSQLLARFSNTERSVSVPNSNTLDIMHNAALPFV